MKRLLLFAAIACCAWWFGTRPGCGGAGALACPDPAIEEGVGTVLEAREVCRDAGYLCHGRKSFQVARWALDKGRLRVRVQLPPFLRGETAREIQAAAVEGIRAWDNHPFPLVIDAGEYSLRLGDIGVVWSQALSNSEAGVARTRGREKGKRFEFASDGLAVAVPPIVSGGSIEVEPGMDPAALIAQMSRMGRGMEMGPALLAQVKAVAMHEMGHVLGLMHSDSTNDIMYPQYRAGETKVRISDRDLATVEALYTLPNGARVQ